MEPATQLPRCPQCGHVMLTEPGCTVPRMRVRTPAGLGVRLPRIPYGRGERPPVWNQDGRCPDCGAPVGQYHQWPCDLHIEWT